MIAILLCTLLASDVVVFAAASLKESFEELGALFEKEHPGARVRLSLAGSHELRAQLVHGAPADLFASADEAQMDLVVREGLADGSGPQGPRIFARNEPVLVVPSDNPAKLRALADLPRARRIVLGAQAVPIGAYSERLIGRRGPAFVEAVEAKVVSRELNVRQVLAKVALGEADAGIVYRTDVAAARGEVAVIEIPPGENLLAAYPLVVLKAAPQKALAAALRDLILAPRGQAVLRRHGFLPP